MNKKEKIEKEIEKTLHCFDTSERLESGPFFYTRVKARIDNHGHVGARFSGLQWIWPVLKPALLVLIVAINVYTIGSYLTGVENSSQTSREQLVQDFAKEFSLNSNSNTLFFLGNE